MRKAADLTPEIPDPVIPDNDYTPDPGTDKDVAPITNEGPSNSDDGDAVVSDDEFVDEGGGVTIVIPELVTGSGDDDADADDMIYDSMHGLGGSAAGCSLVARSTITTGGLIFLLVIVLVPLVALRYRRQSIK